MGIMLLLEWCVQLRPLLSLGVSAPEKFVFCVKEHMRRGDCLVTGGKGRKSHVRDLLIE